MKRKLVFWGVFLLLASLPLLAAASQRTAYVEPFKVAGATGDAALPATLQTLLSSRLNGDTLLVQDAPAGAQILIKGSLVQFGKVFSIDVAARDTAGHVLARAYELGEGPDDLPKALAKVAEKLSSALAAGPQSSLPMAAPASPSPSSAIVKAQPALITGGSGIVRPQGVGTTGAAEGVGQRIKGMYIGMAPLQTLPDGTRELVLLRAGSIHVVMHGAKTGQVAEAAIGTNYKALTVDTVDLDGDGTPEIYLTVMRGFNLSSQVWTFKDNRLTRIAEDVPFYFRALTGPGGVRKLYGQEMGRTDDYYGPVCEMKKTAKGYELGTALKLPKFANIFNFNFFTDREGSKRVVVLHPDGFLLVYSDSGDELWRSSDKYGGSEVYFSRDDSQNERFTGRSARFIFIEQRIAVTGNNEILVPRNGGFFVVGTSRNYSKDSLYAFEWNGSVLDERWHTKEGQNYLADFYFDESKSDLVLLEVVKREGVTAEGASVITVRNVE